jgi:Ca-activated chloride channel family protein
MKLAAHFDISQLDHAKTNTAHLVVSLEAPSIDWIKQRPKVCIFPVIDASGSMDGDKLAYAKASVRKLIDQLSPGDFAGLGVLESKFHLRVKPQVVTPEVKDLLLREVDRIGVMGGTNFSEAIQETLKLIQRLDLPLNFLHRVIIFTDGQPTEGIVDQGAIKKILGDQMGRVSVSFFGYGENAPSKYSGCDHNFLTELSQIGKGNYAYVQNPDDALAAFGKELGGLLSTYASDVKLSLMPTRDHRITKVVTDIPYEEEIEGEILIDVGDLLAEEKRHLVFDVELKEQSKAFPRDTKVLDLRVSFMRVTPDGKEVDNLTSDAKVRFVRKSEAQEKPDPELDKIVALHQMVRAQLEAEEKAKQGQFKEAQELMVASSNLFSSRGHENLAAATRRTGLAVGSSASYLSDQGYLRGMQYASRGMRASAMTADASVVLQELNVSLNNSAQEAYATAFVAPEPSPTWTPQTPPSSKGG